MSMSDSDRHPLRPAARIDETMKWLRNRGYIGSIVPGQTESFTHDILLFGHPGETPTMATIGNTLVWDGHKVTVETQPE